MILCFSSYVSASLPPGVHKWNRKWIQRDKVKNQKWETLSEMGVHHPSPAQVCIPAWKSPLWYFPSHMFITLSESLTGLWPLTVSRHRRILWQTWSPTFAETLTVTPEDHGVTPWTSKPAGSTATRPAALVCAYTPVCIYACMYLLRVRTNQGKPDFNWNPNILVLAKGKTYKLPICHLIAGDVYRATRRD